jgi:hypothetical protein
VSTWRERWPDERRVAFILELPQKYVDLMFEALMTEEFVR